MPNVRKHAAPPPPPASDGPDVIDFIEGFCRGTKGDRAGQLISLDAWQKDLITDLMVLRPDGLRKHRTALIGMPRKNGKSTIGSGLGLYMLVMDGEPGAEVYSCAGDKEQARIVFGEAKKMVEADPELSQMLTLYRDAIEFKRMNGVYRVLSAEAFTKEGLNASGVVFDELHVQPNRELWDVMSLGSGTRRQPLRVAITTAGYDPATICGELYQYGKKVLSGEIDDPTFFMRWWEPKDPLCDWRDPQVWAECNPALGNFLFLEALEEDARTTPENTFRRYHLNQWTTTENAWLPFGAWDACREDGLDLDPGLPLHVGIDVALYNDSTAVVSAQKRDNRLVVRARVWENPYPEGHSQHDDWELNIFEVEDHLRELREQFPVPACAIDGEVQPGPQFSFDPAYFHRSASVLAGEGLAMARFSQHDSLMVPASQGLYQLVVERRLAHNGDPTLARHIGNAVADQKPRGWRLTKPKGSRRKIDAAIATAIAAYSAETTTVPTPPRNVYLDRGLVVL